MFNKKAAREKGVTLIEMMIVIAIIGFIAAVVVNRYTHALDVGKVSAVEMTNKQIATALDAYNVDKGSYPASANVTPTLFGGTGNQYMGSTPLDGAANYVYTLNGTDYNVCSGSTHDKSAEGGLKDFSTGAAPTSNEYICYSPSMGMYTASSTAGL